MNGKRIARLLQVWELGSIQSTKALKELHKGLVFLVDFYGACNMGHLLSYYVHARNHIASCLAARKDLR